MHALHIFKLGRLLDRVSGPLGYIRHRPGCASVGLWCCGEAERRSAYFFFKTIQHFFDCAAFLLISIVFLALGFVRFFVFSFFVRFCSFLFVFVLFFCSFFRFVLVRRGVPMGPCAIRSYAICMLPRSALLYSYIV